MHGSFLGSIGWPALGTVIPGAGLLRTRWRAWGAVMLTLAVVALVAAGAAALLAPSAVLSLALSPRVLSVSVIALIGLTLVWVASILVTHLSLRPSPPRIWQRLLGSVIVGALTLMVALPAAVLTRFAYDTSVAIAGVTAQGGESTDDDFGNAVDPWANKPRLNVLLLGGDNGQDRAEDLGARTDTIILASIDTETGKTTLFSLPRQTQRMPFPEGSDLAAVWPYGFSNGVADNPDYFLNAEYNNVPALAPQAIPAGVQDPGAWVLKESVGAALGLDVDYYAMVNMDGFVEFIDALGGVTVNISTPVPVGGVSTTHTPPDRWLSPGPDQHLGGNDALWYARGRYGTTDYERMSRQRCVIRAVASQADPYTVLSNYEALTKAGSNIIETDVPDSKLGALVTLALKVKDQTMSSVSFENGKDGFSTVYPDWDVVHLQVQEALTEPAVTPAATAAPTATASPTSSATSSPSATGTPTPSEPVDECAYNPPEPDVED